MTGESPKNIWERVVKIAQADGHITQEETTLIQTILESAAKYEQVLEKGLEDGKLTRTEKLDLIDKRAQILDRAYRKASGDEKITDDEYQIIEEVLKILHDLELQEDEYFADTL